jgi:pimeloyl-ACP methyl ester carboxylesterase
MRPEKDTVSVDGLQLRLLATGTPTLAESQSAIVLVHGIGMSHRSFRDLQNKLGHLRARESASPDSPAIIAIDLPGFGGAQPAGRQLRPDGFAELLVTALRSAGITSATIVGQSMGTQVAVEAAITAPDLVNGIVLVGPVVDERKRSALVLLLALMVDCLYERPRMNVVVFSDYVRSLRQYMRELRPMIDYPILSRLALVRQRVEVVRGMHDRVANASWARRVAAAAQDGRLAEFHGPHHVQEHDPVGVAMLILDVATARTPR